MDSLPLGLSVHHFVSSVGAEVGFASLIAVAILVLLYFAQARETATLRTRADEAGFRVQELETRLAELTEQVAALPAEISVTRAVGGRVASAGSGAPGRVAVGVPASAGAAAALFPPSAPAGVAAPALAAATRLIPDPDSFLREGEPEPATAAAGANGDGHHAVVAPVAAPMPDATIHGSLPAPVGAPAGLAAPPPLVLPGAGRPPGAGPPRRPSGPTGQGRPPGAGPTRPVGPARAQGKPMRPPPRRSKGRLVLGGLVAALALAAIAAGVIVLTKGGRSSSASTASLSRSLASRRTSQTVVVLPSTVTVSVLNGTDMQGLAGHVAQRLVADGYRKGAVTNASDQTQTTSVVAYMAASKRRDALAVAGALKLPRASVQPIDASTKAIACPPTNACTSAVVVTIGRDLATQ